MPKAKKLRRQALFLALPRCSRRQNHALLALKITWGRETEAPHKLRTGDTSTDLPRSGRSKFLIGFILPGSLWESVKKGVPAVTASNQVSGPGGGQ